MNESHRGRGAFVVLVGPDGVGKTTVARAIVQLFAGPSGYFHFRPPVLGDLWANPPHDTAPLVDKSPRPGPMPMGWLRLFKHVAICWLGHWITVRPAVRAGSLVVADRWTYGYLVQPAALRYWGPDWLAVLSLRFLPTPDLVVNLTAPAEVISSRKQELSDSVIETELSSWSALPVPNLLTLSSESEPTTIARDILDHLGW